MKQKILVIEDEEIISSMLKDNLELMGFDVIAAESGMEGLRKAEIYKPHLITLDIMMPGLDGITVLEKLKENEKTKDIPVILMSVAGDHEEKGLKMGAVAFFKKPFDFKGLNSKIRSLTEQKSVLVVDDNPDILKLLEVKLNSMGYKVRCAADEKSVMEKISRSRPDVILMDVVLQKHSGMEIIKKLKSDEETADIPVIAYSGFVDDEILSKKIAGADKYFDRKFSAEDLAEEVKDFINKAEDEN